jgi:hypothetical protein
MYLKKKFGGRGGEGTKNSHNSDPKKKIPKKKTLAKKILF